MSHAYTKQKKNLKIKSQNVEMYRENNRRTSKRKTLIKTSTEVKEHNHKYPKKSKSRNTLIHGIVQGGSVKGKEYYRAILAGSILFHKIKIFIKEKKREGTNEY